MTAPEPVIGRRAYGTAARRVFDYIAAGDCYQVNLTFPMRHGWLSGTPLGLYGAFRRTGAVGHGAYVDLGWGRSSCPARPNCSSRSRPARIVTRPMKGTRPRGPDAAEFRMPGDHRRALQAAEKDRAENLMIVDLLRNDISRLARVGSVKVPALFAMETLFDGPPDDLDRRGQLADPPRLPVADGGAFPCGSVTGAPKIRAMEIIREVEPARAASIAGPSAGCRRTGRRISRSRSARCR